MTYKQGQIYKANQENRARRLMILAKKKKKKNVTEAFLVEKFVYHISDLFMLIALISNKIEK